MHGFRGRADRARQAAIGGTVPETRANQAPSRDRDGAARAGAAARLARGRRHARRAGAPPVRSSRSPRCSRFSWSRSRPAASAATRRRREARPRRRALDPATLGTIRGEVRLVGAAPPPRADRRRQRSDVRAPAPVGSRRRGGRRGRRQAGERLRLRRARSREPRLRDAVGAGRDRSARLPLRAARRRRPGGPADPLRQRRRHPAQRARRAAALARLELRARTDRRRAPARRTELPR